MGIVVLSTSYLPPVEYFARLKRAGKVLVESNESYAKQTYRNRCNIAGPNGLQVLTIPILHCKGDRMPIKDIRVDYSTRWQANHWRSIETAYNKSPFFSFYRDAFEPFYFSRYKFLFDLNNDMLSLCMKFSSVRTPISYTESFQKKFTDEQDLRTAINPKNHELYMDFPRYPQVFEPVLGFLPNLSIIDLLFNRGTDSEYYLDSIKQIDQTGYSTRT
jgi:hypothetical protein